MRARKGSSIAAEAGHVRPAFLTREQASVYLQISRQTLARWAAERRGPPYVKLTADRTGGVRYPVDGLAKFLAARSVTVDPNVIVPRAARKAVTR